VRFDPALYQGTAGYYEQFRLPYPDAMIADLARRAVPSGRGRLLDLACGTGQLAFPLRDRFTDVWAVDAEPGMLGDVWLMIPEEPGLIGRYDNARQEPCASRLRHASGLAPRQHCRCASVE
jgi:SAM-dependent methyltransferase